MKKIIACLSLATVLLWLMPLGAFIKPSQEKTACDGKRAFHMCSTGINAAQETDGTKISASNGFSGQGTKSMSSSGDDAVLEDASKILFSRNRGRFSPNKFIRYNTPSYEILVPPKISSF